MTMVELLEEMEETYDLEPQHARAVEYALQVLAIVENLACDYAVFNKDIDITEEDIVKGVK